MRQGLAVAAPAIGCVCVETKRNAAETFAGMGLDTNDHNQGTHTTLGHSMPMCVRVSHNVDGHSRS